MISGLPNLEGEPEGFFFFFFFFFFNISVFFLRAQIHLNLPVLY